MPELVHVMDRLHTIVGSRPVYVDRVSTKTLVPAAVYFLADLHPARTPEEFNTMVLNNRDRRGWFRYFRSHVQGTRAIITTDPHRRAPALWAAAFPRHTTVTLPFGPRTVHVFLR